jgi:hypothetical protein
MKKKLSRRDFLKLAGVGAAVTVPSALGYSVYRSAQGEPPPDVSPYVDGLFTTNLDGSAPILLIVNQDSPNLFGVYLGEILRAEGMNCFHTADLSRVQSGVLEKYDIVILAETPLDASQAEMFEAFVSRGGSLVGMRPDDRLGSVFGVKRSGNILSNGYIKTESDHPVSVGINSSTLQFHSDANEYTLAGAQAVAWLYNDRDTASEYPAITINSFGNGLSSCWAFDLAKSVAYTRQGNPAFSNQERDGHPYIRATDMFVDWIDLERIGIPQADEHQRLFIRILHELSKDKIPLPRLWYFPGDITALLLATGDAHPISSANAIDDILTRVEQRSGRMSIYYSFTLHDDFYRFAQRGRFYATQIPLVGDALSRKFRTPNPYQVDDWRARGHEFTLHPHVGVGICGGYRDDGVIEFDSEESGWNTYWQQFTGLGYGPVSQTVRTHCVLWKGWVDTARLQASHGIRMNMDYYHVGPSFHKKNGDWVFGHFTGSALPMKFIDDRGRLLNIYQQLTQLADEHLFSFPEINWVNVADHTADQAIDISKNLLDFNLKNDFPAAFGVNFHPDPYSYGGRPAEIAGRWLEGTLDYAVEKGIPIWSTQDWFWFTQARQELRFLSVEWDKQNMVLSFGVEGKELSENDLVSNLALLIPSDHMGGRLGSIEVDGVVAKLGERFAGGVHYSWVPISSGTHQVVVRYL